MYIQVGETSFAPKNRNVLWLLFNANCATENGLGPAAERYVIMISGALSISDGNWRTFSQYFNLLSTIFYFENLKISGFVSNYERYGDSSHSKRHLFWAKTKIFNDNYD